MTSRPGAEPHYDVDFFVIGAGSGGVRAGPDRGAARRQNRCGRGVSARRHVRHPRLRAEKALRLCEPVRRRFSRRCGLRLDRRGRALRLADAGRRQRARDIAAVRHLCQQSRQGRRRTRQGARNHRFGPNEVQLGERAKASPRATFLSPPAAIPCFSRQFPAWILAVSSNEIFDLKRFPKRLLVVGGGYIAVEFASIFNKLGADVTMAMRAPAPLRGFDEDLRLRLGAALAHDGVTMKFEMLPTRIDRDRLGLERRALQRDLDRSRRGAGGDRPPAEHRRASAWRPSAFASPSTAASSSTRWERPMFARSTRSATSQAACN